MSEEGLFSEQLAGGNGGLPMLARAPVYSRTSAIILCGILADMDEETRDAEVKRAMNTADVLGWGWAGVAPRDRGWAALWRHASAMAEHGGEPAWERVLSAIAAEEKEKKKGTA